MAAKRNTGKKRQTPAKRKARSGVNLDLVKALGHELRVEILGILNERVASPNELSQELGEGLSQVSYHVKVLKDYKCIKQVKTVPRRGAVEHYYRATASAFLTNRDWHALPRSIRPGLSADLFDLIRGDVVRSLEEGSFDARPDRHLSRTPLLLDEAGWKKVQKVLEKALDEVVGIQKDASARLAKSGEEGINASVAILGFELPEAPSQRGKASKAKAKAKGKGKAKVKGKAKAKGKGKAKGKAKAKGKGKSGAKGSRK